MSDYTRSRWEQIKAMKPRSKMVHVSKSFYLNPLIALCEQAGQPFHGPRYLPHRGVTRNLGHNKAKRARRAAKLKAVA